MLSGEANKSFPLWLETNEYTITFYIYILAQKGERERRREGGRKKEERKEKV